MAQISVTIAGRAYLMACEDGQEAHLLELGSRLDALMADMRARFGEIGSQRITIMAALTVADEASVAERRAQSLADQVDALRLERQELEVALDRVSAAVEDVAEHVRRIAEAL